MTESFVFYRSFHEALKELTREQYGNVLFAINEYALNGTLPEDLTGIEKAIFVMAKPQLDANLDRRESGKLGGRPKKNNENIEKPMVSENSEIEKPMVSEIDEFKKPNVNVNDNVNVNANENLNVNANENLNVNVNENVNGNGECSENPPDFPEIPQKEYAKQIFEKFQNAKLPCWNGNFTSFWQTDFKNTVFLRQGINSKDVLQAIDNYIFELNAPDSYLSGEMGFQSFCESKLFNKMLPENYRHSCFVKNKDKNKSLMDCANDLLAKEADNPAFSPSILYDNMTDWEQSGKPEGLEYYRWQDKYKAASA